MYSLEIIEAINKKNAKPLTQGATTRVDVTHNRVSVGNQSHIYAKANRDGFSVDDNSSGRQHDELPTERPLPLATRTTESVGWVHRLYFGTDGAIVDKPLDALEATNVEVLDVTRTFLKYRADAIFRLGYSFFELEGRWEGTSEHSFLIEVVTTQRNAYQEDIAKLAQEYKAEFNQKAVLVTHQRVSIDLL